jgi:hypothetical protein
MFRTELGMAARAVSFIFMLDGKARTQTGRFGEYLVTSTLELVLVFEPFH